jgi:hypothetical protein
VHACVVTKEEAAACGGLVEQGTRLGVVHSWAALPAEALTVALVEEVLTSTPQALLLLQLLPLTVPSPYLPPLSGVLGHTPLQAGPLHAVHRLYAG